MGAVDRPLQYGEGQPTFSDIELQVQDDDNDDDQHQQHKGESDTFLGHDWTPKKRLPFRSRLAISTRLVLLCLSGLLIVSVVALLYHGSSVSTTTGTTAILTQYSITKVTGLYGSGAWREGEAPEIAAKVPAKDRHNNLERAIALHQAHANIHGHKQVVQTTQLFGTRINNAYTKIGNLLKQNLIEMSLASKGGGAKWLFWHDADTIILNKHISLDFFVADVDQGHSNINMICARDFNGLNAGVFFLRVGEWTSLFLANVLATGRPLPGKIDFWEQGAINEVLAKDAYFGDAKAFVPQEWFNIYPKLDSPGPLEDGFEDTVSPGSFIVHLVGDTKFSPGLFNRYLKIGEGSNSSYHSQAAADRLRDYAVEFWKTPVLSRL